MDYQINFSAFRQNYALPQVLSVQQLAQADGRYLKVFLLIFQTPDRHWSMDLIASLLSLPESVVEDAVRYFSSLGALELTGSWPQPSEEVPILRAGEPTLPEKSAHNEELRFLFSSMESILGRSVSSTDLTEITRVYETCLLPVDVIIMAMEYCAKRGHNDIRYIREVCQSWHRQGIIDHEKADAYLREQAERRSLRGQVLALFGAADRTLTEQEQELIKSWTELGFDFPMFRLAYERTVKRTGKPAMPYANQILLNWKEKGYRTVEQVRRGEPERGAKPSASPETNTSYDLDSLDKFWDEVPDYPQS